MTILDDIDAVLDAQPDLFEHVVDDLFPATWDGADTWAQHEHGCVCDNCRVYVDQIREQYCVCECLGDRVVEQHDGRTPISIDSLMIRARAPICFALTTKIEDGFQAYGHSALSRAYLAGMRGERVPMDVAEEHALGWPPELTEAHLAGRAEGEWLDLTTQP